MPRRKALKSMFGVIATGATVLLMPRRGQASTPPTAADPNAAVISGEPGAGVCANGTCVGTSACGTGMCCTAGGDFCNAFGCCQPPTSKCSNRVCCPPLFFGCQRVCCPVAGGACCGGTACCPPGAPKCCDFLLIAPGKCCGPKCCCNKDPNTPNAVICICPGDNDPVLHFSGGGAFLSSANCKTVCQQDVCCACSGSATSCANTSGVGAVTFTCFNYCTYTLIQSVSLSSFQGTLLGSGGDFQASGIGTAMVNGVPTNISFSAAVTSGVPSISVTNTNTNQMLAGGTGESGLADFGLDIFTA
jgi:hypothetical protein